MQTRLFLVALLNFSMFAALWWWGWSAERSLTLLGELLDYLTDGLAGVSLLLLFLCFRVKKVPHRHLHRISLFLFATILLAGGYVAWEMCERFTNPHSVNGMVVLVLSSIGLVVNFSNARLLRAYHEVEGVHMLLLCNRMDMWLSGVGVVSGVLLLTLDTAYDIDLAAAAIIVSLALWHAARHLHRHEYH